jgi:hypothetical protein
MSRRAVTWMLAASLATLGSIWAHTITYRIVAPNDLAHRQLLARTGHGYLEHAPLVVGLLVACVVIGLALRAAAAFSDRPHGSRPAWPFAALPIVLYAVQEHLERTVQLDSFPLTAMLEPTFLVGVLLQIPFALAALLLARALLGLADELGRALAATTPRPRSLAAFPYRPASAPDLRRRPKLAAGCAERGPPPLRV